MEKICLNRYNDVFIHIEFVLILYKGIGNNRDFIKQFLLLIGSCITIW